MVEQEGSSGLRATPRCVKLEEKCFRQLLTSNHHSTDDGTSTVTRSVRLH